MIPTLEEAIRCYEEEAKKCDNRVNEIILGAERCKQDKEKYTQLAAWLRELQNRRKAPEIVRCGACVHFQCNMRFDGSVPKGADAYECRHWCGGCDPMDYCSYGERAERRTDGTD